MSRSSDPNVRRRQLLQSLGIVGVVGLAGCSVSTGDDSTDNSDGGDTDTSGDSGNSSGTNMASSATGWGWNIAASSLQIAADRYNKQNGTDINIKQLGNWEQRFQTAITSGTGAPEFSSIQNYDVSNYAKIDALRNLTDRIDETNMREKIVDSKWSAVDYNGDYYAIPWDVGPTGVFYKRGPYEDQSINPDDIETWDEFIQVGKKFPDDVAMFNLPTSDNDLAGLWRMLLQQLGGQPVTEDGAIKIHKEKSVRVAQLFQDMRNAGITTRLKTWSAGWFTAFAENSLVSLPSAAWMDGTLRAELPETAGNWGVYKFPPFEKGGSRASNLGGSNIAIPAQIDDDPVVNRAWDFCAWAMTTPEVQNKILEEYGIFPSLKTAYDAPIYEKELEFYDGQAIFGLFADVAKDIHPFRYTVISPVIGHAIVTELNKAINNNKPPEKAMKDAAIAVANKTGRELA